MKCNIFDLGQQVPSPLPCCSPLPLSLPLSLPLPLPLSLSLNGKVPTARALLRDYPYLPYRSTRLSRHPSYLIFERTTLTPSSCVLALL